MATYKATQLFGGAIVVDLPSVFIDVSNLRQVPDNQEVYLDSNGLTSVTFEILEYVDAATAKTDEDALKYHLHDIVSDTGDATRIWTTGEAHLAKMQSTPAFVLFATNVPPKDSAGSGQQKKADPDFVGTLMLLVRLSQHKTDILVSLNVPHVPGEYKSEEVDLAAQKLSPLLYAAQEIRTKILETFEVKDWSLFVNEE